MLDALRRRGIWIALCVVVAAGAALGLSKHQQTMYAATAALLFNNDQLSQQIAGVPTSVAGEAQPENDLRLVRIGDMAEDTADALGHGLTAAKVSDSLSIAQQGETNLLGESTIVEVSASYREPKLAADIANTYAASFVAQQRQANKRYFTVALGIIEKQLAKLPVRAKTSSTGEALEARAQSLRLLAGLQYNGVELVQRASVPTSPSAPRTLRNTLIGAILGLLVGLGLAFLLEHMDQRIRRARDLEEIYRAPLLGLVPQSSALSRPEQRYTNFDSVPPIAEADIFGLILARLRSFNNNRLVRSVLVTSPSPADGKSTIALNLAEASARAGARTLLLEMDFRKPDLASRLDAPSAAGLIDVLNGVLSLDQAIQSVNLGTSAAEQYHTASLDILLCGEDRSFTPAKLIHSPAMDAVWERALLDYDFIVVDSSTLTSVSDAFAILQKVDGVVAVDWVNHNTRVVAQQLQSVLERSAVPLLGVIANRSAKRTLGPPADDMRPVAATAHHHEPRTLHN